MRKVLSCLAAILAVFLPVASLLFAPPTSNTLPIQTGQYLVMGIIYSLYLLALIGFLIGQRHQHLSKYLISLVVVVFVVTLFSLLLRFNSTALSIGTLGAAALLVGAYVALERVIRLQGLVSFLIFLSFLLSLETSLRSIPSAKLTNSVVSIPSLAPPDIGDELLRKNGFRGQQPCTNCAIRPIRIVTMGGSSTYGIPLPSPAQTFSAQLQRLLQKHRPQEHYEVLNAGVAGYGIVQVLDSLKKYVLQFHPDIILINSWFNDSARSSGWYGFVGLSDREAQDRVELFRAIEKLKLYQWLSNSRLYGVFRHYLLQLMPVANSNELRTNRRKSRRRMSPVEFKHELESIVEMGRKYDFLPVFSFEVTNRQEKLEAALRRNSYLRAITDVATSTGSPLIDTITPFAARRSEWLFSDFIHPNRSGHQLIAETIYEQLFRVSPQSYAGVFLTRRGVALMPK